MQAKNGYRDLIVWRKSIELVVSIYELLKGFPKEEMFGLTSQMKRSAVSISSNIAEGYRRATTKDRCHFYTMAFGSTAELETQIEISKRLNFVTSSEAAKAVALLGEVGRMLNKLSATH